MTIRALMDAAAAEHGAAVALRFKQAEQWQSRTYGAFTARVRQIAEVVGGLEIVPGRDAVALMLDNRPEWLEIYAALAGAGVTVVPVDPKLRAAEVAFILADSEAAAIFAGNRSRPLLEEIAPSLPRLRHIALLDGPNAPAPCGGRPCLELAAAMTQAAPAATRPDAWFQRHAPAPESIASIIYTSGTTGQPKGAMLSHANFCADVAGCLQIIRHVTPRDLFLVVLPLFHAFSFTTNFLIPLSRGGGMAFVENLRSVGEDMRVLRPTILMAVPLLAEKLYDRITAGIQENRLARALLALGLRPLVAAKVRRALGGRLRLLVVGGAPCPPHLLHGFRRLGTPIIEGYGLTETAPVVSLSRPEDARVGAIGYALPNIAVRLAEPTVAGIGELEVRGPIVMRGYFHNPAATAEVMDGLWLRTGDLAEIAGDGYITIRGRKKALIVNREGKNIYPEEVEQRIAQNPLVHDVLVLGYHEGGETGERVGVIIVPDLDAIRAARGGVEPPWPEIERLMRAALREACRDLAPYKHPRKVEIRAAPLERTSTHKVRRHLYQGALDATGVAADVADVAPPSDEDA